MGESYREIEGCERIVEKTAKPRTHKKNICDWLPGPKTDWEHNRCPRGCDGRDTKCLYHPHYVPTNQSQDMQLLEYFI